MQTPQLRLKSLDTKKKLLEMVTEQVNPTKLFRAGGESTAAKLFEILKSKSFYKISRYKIIGSIGKRSSVGISPRQADFDMVIFVNKEWPPFTKVIENFVHVLSKHYNRYDFILKLKTSHSLEFRVLEASKPDTFLSFDLFPTTNLLTEEYDSLPEAYKEQVQTERALKYIQMHPDATINLRSYHCTMLADRNVCFVYHQSLFVHQVILLAKMWNRRVLWKGKQKLYGRSTMIEFVAIAAACKEEIDACTDHRDQSILQAFQNFLKKFINFDSDMYDFFTQQQSLNFEVRSKISSEELFERDERESDEIDNPYNNFPTPMLRELRSAFFKHAKLTLAAVQNYKKFGRGAKYNLEGYFGQ